MFSLKTGVTIYEKSVTGNKRSRFVKENKLLCIAAVFGIGFFVFAEGKNSASVPETATVPVAAASTEKTAPAAVSSAEKTPAEKITFMLHHNGGLEKNADEISTLAASLAQSDRELLYKKNAKKIGLSIGLNFLPFGVGSWTEGDVKGGLILTGTTVLVCGCAFGVVYGFAGLFANALGGAISNSTGSDSSKNDNDADLYGGLMIGSFIVGVGTVVFNVVFGVIRPQKFGKAYNAKLTDTLRTEAAGTAANGGTVSFAPVLNYYDKKTTVGIAIAY